jgi:hypothetical protein
MGHKRATDTKVMQDNTAAYTYPKVDPYEAYGASNPRTKARLKIDSYGSTEPAEAYAQAFKNAFGFLGETARDPQMDYRKFAGDLEGSTPGMGMIVQDLMKLPIFAKHPLQGKIFREKK